LAPTDVERLGELKMENAKLKRMLGKRELAIETLKEINPRKRVSSEERRDQVAPCCVRDVIQRSACELRETLRSALRSQPVRSDRV
jgi:hypothetical protein